MTVPTATKATKSKATARPRKSGKRATATTQAPPPQAAAEPAADRPAPPQPTAGVILDVPVEFGGVSFGDETARLGLRIARPFMYIDAADELLCGRRLSCRVVTCPNGDDPNQKYLVDGVGASVEAVADVKRFGVSPKAISANLTFSLGEIDVRELASFSKKTGRLIVLGVGVLPDTKVAADGPPDDDDDIEGV